MTTKFVEFSLDKTEKKFTDLSGNHSNLQRFPLCPQFFLVQAQSSLWNMLRWLESLIECLQWRWNTNVFIVEFLVWVQTMQLLNTHWSWYDGLFISTWELTEALWLASTLWYVSFSPLERNEGLISLFSHSFIKWMSEWTNKQNSYCHQRRLWFLKLIVLLAMTDLKTVHTYDVSMKAEAYSSPDLPQTLKK